MQVFQTHIEPGGKIQLPKQVLEELEFETGKEIQLEIEKKSLRVSLSAAEQRKQAQNFIKSRISKQGSAVDEFISDRRNEALND